MKKDDPELPTGPLRDLLRWWRRAGVKGVVIGGLAVAVRGRPRVTRDVDAIVFVDEKRWPRFVETGATFCFHPRTDDWQAFARETRVIILNHQTSGIDLDLIIGAVAFEQEVLNRAQRVKFGRLSVPVATTEDLIILKLIAARPKDIQDIDGLLDATAHLDSDYLRKQITQFADWLDAPSLTEDLVQMLARHEQIHRSRST